MGLKAHMKTGLNVRIWVGLIPSFLLISHCFEQNILDEKVRFRPDLP